MGKPRKGSGKRTKDTEDLEKTLQGIEGAVSKNRQTSIQTNVTKFLEHKPEDVSKKSWETEGKGLGFQGELLTLEDLIYLKPFAMEDLNSQIAFRANDKMMRSAQRLKEASGGVYDIMSDLYRDAFIIGLLVLSERHKSILGLEIVISQAENHQRLKDEAVDTARRLKAVLRPLAREMQMTYFRSFMEAMNERPRWLQETYLEEIRADKMLADLLEGLTEDDE